MSNNKWINHIKQFASENNISYRDALKHPDCKMSYHQNKQQQIHGGEINANNLQQLLKKSYAKKLDNYGDFIVDKQLSGQRVQVYHNPKTNQTVVSHRGTQGTKDVFTDIGLAMGFKNNKRFKHAEKIQKQAENKYGKNNVSTIGHSLGAAIAEKVGGKSKEIITYNKGATLFDKPIQNNQTDIRTDRDVISFLKPFNKGKNDTTIKSKSWNPLVNHNTDQLSLLDKNKMFGVK
jgi:hypothetical protein